MEVGDIIQGRVTSIKKTHLIVSIKNDWTGLLHISKVSDYFVGNIGSMFKANKKYWFEIIKIDNNKKRVKLSWKSIMPRFEKDPFEYNIEETENGFENLKKHSDKGVEKW